MILNPVIAIDGPAASGKSTVARKLAAALGFIYVDTGAMYRSYAWQALEHGFDISSREKIASLVESVRFEPIFEGNKLSLRINGQDPAEHIRSERVNGAVSAVAAVPELREFLVIRQRMLRNEKPLVMEGRDIGTVVFTDTPHKYFIDADLAVRDQRRKAEGQTDSLSKRDAADSNRKVAPLTRAADAEKIDSTHQSADEIVAYILKKLEARGLNAKA